MARKSSWPHISLSLRVSDVNSPVFLYFWFCYIKSQFLFFVLINMAKPCIIKNGAKNINSPGHRFTEGAVIMHTKISVIYENGSKFASFEKTVFPSIIPNML